VTAKGAPCPLIATRTVVTASTRWWTRSVEDEAPPPSGGTFESGAAGEGSGEYCAATASGETASAVAPAARRILRRGGS
jgi:hypothetical protein